jgi:serine/threonine-protein kinase RsbW
MLVQLLLYLPKDAASVPLARGVLDSALTAVGVTEQCRGDIGLALSEACGNVVTHANEADRYEVKVSAEERQCVIEVINVGGSVDYRRLVQPLADPKSERGRGLHIIRSVMDVAEVAAGPAGGLAVRMIKRLVFAPSQRSRPHADPT